VQPQRIPRDPSADGATEEHPVRRRAAVRRRPTPDRRVLGDRRALGVVAAALSIVLSACGVPIPGDVAQPAPEAAAGPDVDPLLPADEGSELLAAQLADVAAEVAIVRALLDEAAALVASAPVSERPAALAQARELGRIAAARLLGEPVPAPTTDTGDDGSSDGDDGPAGPERADEDAELLTPPGLLPAIDPDRAGLGSADLMTALVTLAGDVGGERSRAVLELVRDPMVGDLGVWQRDPLGVIALVRASVEGERVPAQLDAALLELPGELPRALGYAFALADARDVAMAEHAATRGAGRLGVVLVAIELTLESLGTSAGDAVSG
jgi:hypothetical protein